MIEPFRKPSSVFIVILSQSITPFSNIKSDSESPPSHFLKRTVSVVMPDFIFKLPKNSLAFPVVPFFCISSFMESMVSMKLPISICSALIVISPSIGFISVRTPSRKSSVSPNFT